MFGVTTNTQRWGMLVEHLERDDATNIILWASLGYAQLAVGSVTQLLSLNFATHRLTITSSRLRG